MAIASTASVLTECFADLHLVQHQDVAMVHVLVVEAHEGVVPCQQVRQWVVLSLVGVFDEHIDEHIQDVRPFFEHGGVDLLFALEV